MGSKILVMGVCGSGKSTLGSALAQLNHVAFVEADDFHSRENKEKMAKNIPLTDEDRAGWLEALNREMSRHESGCVVACSALKAKYRQVLFRGTDWSKTAIVWIHGSEETLRHRLDARQGHFVSAGLLKSQLEILEEPSEKEAATVVKIKCEDEPALQLSAAVKALDVNSDVHVIFNVLFFFLICLPNSIQQIHNVLVQREDNRRIENHA